MPRSSRPSASPDPDDRAPDDERDAPAPPPAGRRGWGAPPPGPAPEDDEDVDDEDADDEDADDEDADDEERDTDDLPPRSAERGPPQGGAPAAPNGFTARRRGRAPGSWPEGFGPETLESYRARFGLSEKKLADYLGVSVPALRNWTKGGKAPAAERHGQLRELLGRDYVPGVARPPRPTIEAASPRPTTWDLNARPSLLDAAPAGEPAALAAPPPEVRAMSPAQAIVHVAEAYLRSPGGQNLTPDQLIELLERIKRTLG